MARRLGVCQLYGNDNLHLDKPTYRDAHFHEIHRYQKKNEAEVVRYKSKALLPLNNRKCRTKKITKGMGKKTTYGGQALLLLFFFGRLG